MFASSRRPGRPCSDSVGHWHGTRREEGIEHVRLHDLRRSFASQCMIEGVPLPVVSKLHHD